MGGSRAKQHKNRDMGQAFYELAVIHCADAGNEAKTER
jgi:hypothetical protein